jgi:N-hydroxyarylamine O-acetyltransferase
MEDTSQKLDTAVFDKSEYFARIGMESIGATPDLAGLKLLQRQHLLNVPFENLDIHWKRPIVLDTDRFYQKIVRENRGGFCYELNGLFNELLREVGFETRLLSARVASADGGFSPEFDHLSILVMIGEMQYIADVGFGSFTTEPMRFAGGEEQIDEAGTFMIRRQDDEYFDVARKDGNEWRSEYMFRPLGHDLSEFAGMCDFHQTSPESHFMKHKICSILTPSGRKTLTDEKFIVSENGQRTEVAVVSDKHFAGILATEFGIRQNSDLPSV